MPSSATRRLTRLGAALAAAGAASAAFNARALRRPELGRRAAATVSVLVPARNEADRIGRCLDALQRQAVAEILVLDDGSTDGTGDIARALDDPRVRVLAGTAPPAGWLGKAHACRQLATAARGEVLAFVDADVVVLPGGVQAAAALLEHLGVDLLSAHPREEAVSPAERLVQPLLQWSVLTFLPLPLAERSARTSLTAANGQFLLVRRAAYERAGGHVPDAVLDDVALARAVKRTGGRCAWVDGSRLARCRMYVNWRQLRDGYEKSLWTALPDARAAVAVMGGLTLAYVVPPLAMLRRSRAGAAGYLAGVAGRWVSARATGGRPLDAVAHPLSILLLVRLTAGSLLRARQGRLRWAGRPVQVTGSRSPDARELREADRAGGGLH